MPLKILVVGASQGTGALAVREALSRGHQVTALSRSPQKLGLEHPKLRLVAGDFHNAESMRAAAEGQDAVIITASPTSLRVFTEFPDYISRGTGITIDAMKPTGARRLVVLSALGVGESARLLPALARHLVLGLVLKRPYADHELQERLVRESGLDWVIARPIQLTNGKARHRYRKEKGITKVPWRIARADVAHFLVEACESTEWVRSTVQLGG